MRIAFFSQWAPPEPAAIVGSLARELCDRGHAVDYVTGLPNYPTGRIYEGYQVRWRSVEVEDGLRTVRVPLFPSHDRSGLRRMLNYMTYGLAASTIGTSSTSKADVAYVYHPPMTAAWPARVLKALRGTPFVLHVQDMWPDSVVHSGMLGAGSGRSLVERSLTRLCELTYSAASELVVISEGFKRLLLQRGVPAAKITVVPNWADESTFSPRAREEDARRQIGPPDRRVVLYAGNFGDYQGLDEVIRAFAALGKDTRLHLTLVGDGIARARLQEVRRSEGADNVWILDRRDPHDVPQLLAAADVHLISLVDLPFFASTIPGKTQVALACERPVLAALQGDAAKLVESAGCGVTCAPGKDGVLAGLRAIAALGDEELEKMGRAGGDYYRRHLALRQGAGTIEAILRRVATAGPGSVRMLRGRRNAEDVPA